MKKILTVSLMAMMVVGAARADIASVGYVEDKLATKANASDVTSINAKIGTVADGKTVVEMIAVAKQEAIEAAGEAEYDDTAVRGLIAGKENGLNKKNEIDEDWLEDEKKQYYPSVYLTEEMIATSAIDLGGLVADNKAAIKAINEGAVMNSGITADKVTAYEGYDARITANATAAAGAQAAAEAAQESADSVNGVADIIMEEVDLVLNEIDTIRTDVARKVEKSIYNAKVAELEQADTDNLAAAKAYADGLADNYDAKGAAATAKSEAIAASAEAADAAYAAKTYEGRVEANETAIAANTAAAAAAKSAADEAQADADANTQAIEKINIASAQLLTQGAGDGQYALTMTKSGDSLVYKWEMIGR